MEALAVVGTVIVHAGAQAAQHVVQLLCASGIGAVVVSDDLLRRALERDDVEAVVCDDPAVIPALVGRDAATPAIYLDISGDPLARAQAIELGAADAIPGPIDDRELCARVCRIVRPSLSNGHIRAGSLDIDTVAASASLGGTPLDLRPLEFKLLAELASHPRRAYSRESLLSLVWGSDAVWQSPATVTEHVHRLRRKLNGAGPRIETVRGLGYRLVPDSGE